MAEPKERKTQTKTIVVRPVHGPMHHILQDYPIVGLTEVAEIDTWLRAQIEAGLVIVVK